MSSVRQYSRMIRAARAAVFTAALTLLAVSALAQQSGVIPKPAQIKPGSGSFELSTTTILEVPRGSRGAEPAARYLADLWQRTNGLILAVRLSPADTSVGAPVDAPASSLIRFE